MKEIDFFAMYPKKWSEIDFVKKHLIKIIFLDNYCLPYFFQFALILEKNTFLCFFLNVAKKNL